MPAGTTNAAAASCNAGLLLLLLLLLLLDFKCSRNFSNVLIGCYTTIADSYRFINLLAHVKL